MSWKRVDSLSPLMTLLPGRTKRKRRFLVDENLGPSVTQMIRQVGYNVKDASELGLVGRSDEDVFSLAYKERRCILTHDRDFLNNRLFPPYANPGIIILPGASGDDNVLLRSLSLMLFLVGRFSDYWNGRFKMLFSEDNRVTIFARDRTGAMRKSVMRVEKDGTVEEWVND